MAWVSALSWEAIVRCAPADSGGVDAAGSCALAEGSGVAGVVDVTEGVAALDKRGSELLVGSGDASKEKVVVLGPVHESVARDVASCVFVALTIVASFSHVAGSMDMSTVGVSLEMCCGSWVSLLVGKRVARSWGSASRPPTLVDIVRGSKDADKQCRRVPRASRCPIREMGRISSAACHVER